MEEKFDVRFSVWNTTFSDRYIPTSVYEDGTVEFDTEEYRWVNFNPAEMEAFMTSVAEYVQARAEYVKSQNG